MRAKPKLTYSLLAAAVALALPGMGHALGLGKLTVNSALGQPLSAQIELTSAARDELDSLAARIADASVYRQHNLAYPGVLTRARVTVERDAAGTAYLRVTTQAPVNEPFLDLLVEINWASGRVVRDYTFLLDPPGTTMLAQPVEPVAPARAAAPARPAAAAPTPAPAAQGGETYTVKRGDTLSKIANDFRAPSATLDQMLVALFKNNADAFDGKNMNRLRTGAIITVPSADDATSTPAGDATKVVRVQAADWRAYRDRVAAAAPVAEGAGGRAAAGRIGTAVEEKTPAAPPGRDQVRVSKDAGAGVGAGAAEEAIARDKALREAQTRIASLEKTIQDLQRAIELKSPAGAQAQAQAEAAKAKAAPTPPAPITKAPEPVVAAKAPEPPKAEPAKAAEPVKAPEPPKAEPPKAAEPAPAAEPPKAEPPKAEPPKAGPPKAVPKAAPAKEPPGFFEDMMANTPTWAIAGGALAIVGGIVALIAARRRKTTKFEDSIISGTDIKTNTVFGSTGGGVVNTGDNSLASDFSREGLGNIDTDEVDPIAEAEVYLAYGRDAQAEEILKEALKKDPHRQEIYLKLLEIHAQHNKPSAFETVAAELYSVSQGQGDVWQKAVGLGRQLDPNNPMFAEGGAAAAAAMAAAAGAAAATVREAPAHDEPTVRQEPPRPAPIPADVAPDMGDTGGGLDFKLDEEISIAPSSGAGAKPKSPIDILAGAEAELGKTARSAAAALHEGVVDTTRPAPAPVLHDMDFTLDATTKPAPLRPQAPKPEPVLTSVAPTTQPAGAASALARPQAAIDLDKLELSFDPEKAHYEDPTPSVLDGQWHDAATKLDLAKAYQEMGDVEGAREILQEVLHEGDEQQKSEAQSLISKLG
jgi:pilus assembly protein FimV